MSAPPDWLRCALPQADPALALPLARPRLREAAVTALAAARARPTHATPILASWFRETRWLGSKERPAVSEAVYGVIRHEGVLTRAGARDDAEKVAGFAGLAAGDRLEALAPTTPEADFAAALSLPEPIAAEWQIALGEEALALGAAIGGRAPLTVRANRARCTRDALAARLAEEGVPTEPCAHAPDGLHLTVRLNASALPSFRDGWFEVQDEASQRLIAAIAPHVPPDALALDLCAGAGGKALALAAAGARVLACDVRDDALRALGARAARAGLSANIRVDRPRRADLVLVDAPCSGTGRLRRDPGIRWGLVPGEHLVLQRRLLVEGASWVRRGGVLAYATCSLIAAENAHTPPNPAAWDLLDRTTLWPHRDGTDGFHWSLWRRR